MITMQCKKCENIIKYNENILTTVMCQKCGNNVFTFDGEIEFISKDGVVTNTDSTFTSTSPCMYSMKRPVRETKKELLEVKVREIKEPEVTVFKEEPVVIATAKEVVEEIREESKPKPKLRKRRLPLKKK